VCLAGPHGPFQRERLSSASTGAGSGGSSSSSAAAGAAAVGKHYSMLGYLPQQMPALLRMLEQRLGEVLGAGGLEQQEAAVLQECLQVSLSASAIAVYTAALMAGWSCY
jgi:hypothetical protein